MQVKELIAKLQKCNPELEVQTEGCDCSGESDSVHVLPVNEYGPSVVMICRTRTEYQGVEV